MLAVNENKILLRWETHGAFGYTSKNCFFFLLFSAHAVGMRMQTGPPAICALVSYVWTAEPDGGWTLYLVNQHTNYWAELTAGKQSCLSESLSQWQALLAVTANTCTNVNRRGHICLVAISINNVFLYGNDVSCRFVF